MKVLLYEGTHRTDYFEVDAEHGLGTPPIGENQPPSQLDIPQMTKSLATCIAWSDLSESDEANVTLGLVASSPAGCFVNCCIDERWRLRG